MPFSHTDAKGSGSFVFRSTTLYDKVISCAVAASEKTDKATKNRRFKGLNIRGFSRRLGLWIFKKPHASRIIGVFVSATAKTRWKGKKSALA